MNIEDSRIIARFLRVNIEDSRIIARFQCLLTESLVAKRLGQSRPDSKDALYQMLFEELELAVSKELPSTETSCSGQISTLSGSQDWRGSAAPIMRCLSLRKKQSTRHADRSRKGGVATALVPLPLVAEMGRE